jgi:hypothetical protein
MGSTGTSIQVDKPIAVHVLKAGRQNAPVEVKV